MIIGGIDGILMISVKWTKRRSCESEPGFMPGFILWWSKARRTAEKIWPLHFFGWWFWTFFIFHNIWDNPSHWLIFFKMVKTTNHFCWQAIFLGFLGCNFQGFLRSWTCSTVPISRWSGYTLKLAAVLFPAKNIFIGLVYRKIYRKPHI